MRIMPRVEILISMPQSLSINITKKTFECICWNENYFYKKIIVDWYLSIFMFCYILHQLYLIIRMIRKFPEYML